MSSSMPLLYGLQTVVRVVFVDYNGLSETKASCSSTRKEQLSREDTDASRDFYYYKVLYMQGYATTLYFCCKLWLLIL